MVLLRFCVCPYDNAHEAICTVHSIIKTIVIVIHLTKVIVLHAFYVHCCLKIHTHTHSAWGKKINPRI